MKKLLCLALAVLMLFALAACAENPTPTEPKNDTAPATQAPDTQAPETTQAPAPAEAPTPAEIEAAIAAALGEGDIATVDVTGDDLFKNPVGWLDQEKVKAYVSKEALVSARDPDKVAIAACEEDYADEAVSIFNESLAQSVSYAHLYNYGIAKAENARLYKVGGTVMLILAGASPDEDMDDEAKAKLALDEYAKIDAAIESLFGFVPENLAVIPEDNGSGGGLLGG